MSILHSAQYDFVLANNGQSDLIITDVSTSCSCTTTTLSPATIPPGGRIEFTVTYDPKGRTGHFKDYIIITSNDPANPVQRIKISGVVVADAAASIAPTELAENAPITSPPPSSPPLDAPSESSAGTASPAYSMVKPELTPSLRPPPLFEKRGGRGVSSVYFFHSPTCPDCAYIKDVFLPNFRKKVGQNLVIKEYDLTSLANYETLLAMEKQLGRKIGKTPPLIIVGRTVLQGRRAIVDGLDHATKTTPKTTSLDTPHTPNPSIHTPLRNLGLLAVVTGGLVDGINPCAFTTLIFLLSYLALAGRKGRQLVISGAAFTAGVFIAYFLVGLGLLELIGRVRILAAAGRGLTLAAAGTAGILGGVSLYDYVQIKRGKVGEVKLQLGEGLKKKIHAVIRARAGGGFYPAAGFAAGFLVALLEFPCTGQVYFPIVVALREIAALQARAVGYLLLYDLLFILPLIVVFGLAYWGVTSVQLAAVMRRNLGRTKLITAAVFLGLGAVLVMVGI